MFRPTQDQLQTLCLALALRAERSRDAEQYHVANTYLFVKKALTDKAEFDRLITETLKWAASKEDV